MSQMMKWQAAINYGATLRNRTKQAFAFEYGTYLFGSEGTKLRWNGKRVEQFAEIAAQVPLTMRREVYKKINAIRDADREQEAA